jgi:amino acid permease
MTANEFLSREEILAGLTAKRAKTLLFLIESRTAHLTTQSRHAMERFPTEGTTRDRNLAFLEAFSLGRQPPLRPTIRDLERHAPQWADLVPELPRARAALAHNLGAKYTFSGASIPNIRAALGLDEPEVQAAYERLYGQPLATIYAPRLTLVDRLRWAGSTLARRLESLPAFWTAYAMTLTETVGAGILALPIATAGVGPLPGVGLLIISGLINVLTIAYMAESVSRSGTIRYGNGFIGRVVRNYLGDAGSLILSLGIFAICFLILWAYYMGFSATMEDATTLPAEIWVAVLFLVGLYYVRRESLNATVASALLVGMTNIGLILALSCLALMRVQPENLLFAHVPFVGGRPFDASIVSLVFGVVAAAYFGHLSVSNCARVVIRRDPSGRSLLWGCVAAQATAMTIYSIWVIAVGGAIDPQALAGETGTALIPLAREAGGAVKVLGSAFTILAMGMASVHFSLGLSNLTREWLPKRSRPTLTLPRRRGRVLLRPRRGPADGEPVALTYLGLQGDKPHLRLDMQRDGRTQRADIALGERWESDGLPMLAQSGVDVVLEIVQASAKSLTVRIETTLRVSYEGAWDTVGLSMADVPALDTIQRRLITWLMRRQTASVSDVAVHLGLDEEVVRDLVALMMDEGLIVETERDGEPRYHVLLGSRGRRTVPQHIWRDLGLPERPAVSREMRPGIGSRAPAIVRRVLDGALSERGRSLLSLVPIVFAFLLTEWLLLTGTGSFSELLSFLGVIVISLLSGIFPVLLLVSSRQKGEFVPGVVYRFLGHPVLLGGIYALSLASLFLHGLVIWEDPLWRGGAVFVGVAMVGITLYMKRRDAFAPRMTVMLRQDPEEPERSEFAVTAAGRPAPATVQLAYGEDTREVRAAAGHVPAFPALRRAAFHLPSGLARELKVWVHKATVAGHSENLPVQLEVYTDGQAKRFDLSLLDAAITLPDSDARCRVDIHLGQAD